MAASRPAGSSPAAASPASTRRRPRAASARPAARDRRRSRRLPFGAAGADHPRRLRPARRDQRPRQHARRYRQNSRNFALFTHNIFHITDKLDLTLGLRYTNERKDFDATFGNDNTACVGAAGGAGCRSSTNPALGARLARRPDRPHLPGQFDRRAQRRRRSTTSAARTSSPAPASCRSSRPTTCCSTRATRAATRRAASTSTARRSRRRSCRSRRRRAAPRRWSATSSSIRRSTTPTSSASNIRRGPVTLNAVVVPPGFQELPAEHVQRHGLPRPEHQRLRQPICGGDRTRDPSARRPAPAPPDDVSYGVRSTGVELEAALRPRRDLSVNARPHLRRHQVSRESGRQRATARRSIRRSACCRATICRTRRSWSSPARSPGRRGSAIRGLSGLFYVDARLTGDYNTGSDLFPQKEQDGFAVVNARLGIRGRGRALGDRSSGRRTCSTTDYTQVAFNSPFQAGATAAPFVDPQFPGGRQIFSAFLAEPRTYGITGRFRF